MPQQTRGFFILPDRATWPACWNKRGLLIRWSRNVSPNGPMHRRKNTRTRVMELAAAIQNLMAKLLPDQLKQVKRMIIEAASLFQHGNHVTFPIAVRMVAARKPL